MPEVVRTIDLMLRRLALSLVWEEYAIARRLWKFYLRIDATRAYLRSVIQGKMAERLSRLQQAGKEEEDIPDLVSYLTKNMDTPKGLSQQEAGILAGDLIVAGGDTSATTLSGLIYHLCTNQSKLQKLTQEIRSTFSSEEEITLTSTNSLKYQIAVFNEGHRLFPAAPESTRRVTNKGGNMICGELIPANVRVGVYHWAAGHNSGSWKDANEFIPERWLGEKEYEDDKRGVIQPFNTGPRNCIGQNLAMSQMRLMLARLIWNFDIELCKESDDWLKMDAHALVYRKRPLMVSLKSVRV
jgi:cytochrome P450